MTRRFSQVARVLRDIQGYRRLRIRSYQVPPELTTSSAHEVIAAFMEDEAYNTWFIGKEMLGGYDTNPLHAGVDLNDLDARLPPGKDPGLYSEPRHGPFLLSSLNASLYEPLPLQELRQRFDVLLAKATHEDQYPYQFKGFLDSPHHPYAGEAVRELLDEVNQNSSESFVLNIAASDERYQHRIALQGEFEEFIVLDRADRILYIIVVMSA